MELVITAIAGIAIVCGGGYVYLTYTSIRSERKALDHIVSEIEDSVQRIEGGWNHLLPILRRNATYGGVVENVTKARANFHSETGWKRVTSAYPFFMRAYAKLAESTVPDDDVTGQMHELEGPHRELERRVMNFNQVAENYNIHLNTPAGNVIQGLFRIEHVERI